MPISVPLDKKTVSLLEETAKLFHISKSEVIKRSLSDYCSKILEEKHRQPYELIKDLLVKNDLTGMTSVKAFIKNYLVKIATGGLSVFFLLFILSGPGTGLASDEDNVSHQYPVLVVGNIEGLIPLTYTPYLDGKPVIFFSQAYQTTNPLRLLEMAPTVVFQDGYIQDLLLDVFPANGFNNHDPDKRLRYRFMADNKPVEIMVPREEKYLIFGRVKKDSKNKKVSVKLDDKGLTLSETGRWWSGEALLSKGRHAFAASEAVEEMVIIPQEEYRRYYRYMKKLVKEKSLVYLFNKSNVLSLTFEVVSPNSYVLKSYIRPVYKEIKFRQIGQRLDGSRFTPFKFPGGRAGEDSDLSGRQLRLDIDLEENPGMEVVYQLIDRPSNGLGLLLELDTDIDGLIDAVGYVGGVSYRETPLLEQDMSGIRISEKDFFYKAYRELGWPRGKVNDWYYDALGSAFENYRENGALVVRSDLSKGSHFVLSKVFDPIDLRRYQKINLVYRVDNFDKQELTINFRLDTDGNGRPDKTISNDFSVGERTPLPDGYTRLSLDALNRAGCNPKAEEGSCHLVEIIILCTGSGKFYLRDFAIAREEMAFPAEVKEYLDQLKNALEKKVLEEDSSWFSRSNKEYSFRLIPLKGEEKSDKGYTRLSLNLEGQIKKVLPDRYFLKIKGLKAFLYDKESVAPSFWSDTLERALKEVSFFTEETLEIPRFIADNKTEKEWQDELQEEVLRIGVEKALYKRDWANDTYDIRDYAWNEQFDQADVYQGMKDAADLDKWRIQGEDAWFNYGIKPKGIEVAAYFDGTEAETERVVFIPHKFDYAAMDLKRDISLEILYNLEDANTTEIGVYLGLDKDGDGVEDARVGFLPMEEEEVTIRGKKLRRNKIGSDKIRDVYPEALGVTHFEVSFQKKKGVSFAQRGVIKKFLLKEVRLKVRGKGNREMVLIREGDQYRLVPGHGKTIWQADFSLEEKAPGQEAIAGFKLSTRNASYYTFQGPDGLHFEANFPSTVERERHVLLRKEMPNIDLEGYPYLRLDYVWLGGNGELEDMIIEIKGRTGQGERLIHKIAGSRFLEYPVDLWQELKSNHNGIKHFFLEEIGIYLEPFVGQGVGARAVGEGRELAIIIKKMQLFALNSGGIQDLMLKTMVPEIRLNSIVQVLHWETIPLAETRFIHKPRGQDHYLKVLFNGDGLKEEGIILGAETKTGAIPLEDIKSLAFDYRIDNPKVQGILILPVLTDEGQKAIEARPISFMHLSAPTGTIKFDLQGRIRQAVSYKSPLYLKGLRFYLLKSPGVNCRDNHLTGYYTFAIEDLNLTTATITTLLNKILRQATVKVNGKRYSLVDADMAGINKNQVIKRFLEGSMFDLGFADLKKGTNSIEMLSSDYVEVELVEISTVGKDETKLAKRKEPGIDFKKINPTRYVVDVEAGEPFWLVFSESFHEGWRAYIRQSYALSRQPLVVGHQSSVKNEEPWSALVSAWADRGKRIELAEHYMVNGYANGWHVPLDQIQRKMENGGPLRFQIVLEYKPQRLFEIGVIISSITLISCLLYLAIDFVRRRI